MENIIQIYTIDNCPYCNKAKNLLNVKNLSFIETHVDTTDSEFISKLTAKSGFRTFPQIFLGDKVIGGFTDLEQYLINNEK